MPNTGCGMPPPFLVAADFHRLQQVMQMIYSRMKYVPICVNLWIIKNTKRHREQSKKQFAISKTPC